MKQKNYKEVPLSEEAQKARDIYLKDVFSGMINHDGSVSINYGVAEINGKLYKYRCKTTFAEIGEEEFNKIRQYQINSYGTKH